MSNMFRGIADPFYRKTPQNDRIEQMTKQQRLIEQKKQEIQKKLEEKKRKETEEALKKLKPVPAAATSNDRRGLGSSNRWSGSGSRFDRKSGLGLLEEEKPVGLSVPQNIFSNDGSFLDQFRKISGIKVNPKQKKIEQQNSASFYEKRYDNEKSNTTSGYYEDGSNSRSEGNEADLRRFSESPVYREDDLFGRRQQNRDAERHRELSSTSRWHNNNGRNEPRERSRSPPPMNISGHAQQPPSSYPPLPSRLVPLPLPQQLPQSHHPPPLPHNVVVVHAPPPTMHRAPGYGQFGQAAPPSHVFPVPPPPLTASSIPPPAPLNPGSIPSPSPILPCSIPSPSPLQPSSIPPPSPILPHSIPPPSPMTPQTIPQPSPMSTHNIPPPPRAVHPLAPPSNLYIPPPPNLEFPANDDISIPIPVPTPPPMISYPISNMSLLTSSSNIMSEKMMKKKKKNNNNERPSVGPPPQLSEAFGVISRMITNNHSTGELSQASSTVRSLFTAVDSSTNSVISIFYSRTTISNPEQFR